MSVRINKFVAQATGMSRREADKAISQGRVTINGSTAVVGESLTPSDKVGLDNHALEPETLTTIILNKPAGFVCSRRGQGSQTIYDLLPSGYGHLKPVGRLDKDSSGLILLTNDGNLANQLTHPRYSKVKVYEVELNAPLQPFHHQLIADQGVRLFDGVSKFQLSKLDSARHWQVTMTEGRNRQIRRTFDSLGYKVTRLHRIQFGDYKLGQLAQGRFRP